MNTFSDEQLRDVRQQLVPVVSAEVPLRRQGNEFRGLCCFHKEKTPSFYVSPDKGFYHCFGCGAHGDAIDFVRRTKSLDFAEAVRTLLNLPATLPKQYRTPPRRQVDRAEDVAKARAIWGQATTDYHAVPLYLYSRYLPDTIPPTIREHQALFCPERQTRLPALVAAFQSSAGRVTAVQRIWLEDSFVVDEAGGDPKGSRIKEAPKMAKGVIGDGAMRLARLGDVLGLAEGLETALACVKLYRLPTWGLGGLSRLGYPAHDTQPTDGSKSRRVETRPPTVWIPDQVRHLVIFGDGNEIGRTVAEFAAAWWNWAWRGTGRSAEAVLPEAGYEDFQHKLRVAALAGAIR